MLEQLAADYGDRMKVSKVEINRNPQTALASLILAPVELASSMTWI